MKKCLFIIAVLISCQLSGSYFLIDPTEDCQTGYSKQGSGTMRFNTITGQSEPIYVECVKDEKDTPVAEASIRYF
jgi:hypothetical protein